jgi:hypothetical protein
MLFWIIQTTVISVILIFLVHYLIEFFKSTLTVPKIKDLVNTPTQKYENMFNVISNKKSPSFNNEYNIEDLIPKTNTDMKSDMKSELKMFLKTQLNNSPGSSTNISTLDSMTANTYSSYN